MKTITKIFLCSVPLQWNHQLDFDSETAQYNYFLSKTNKVIENCRYIARTDNVIVQGVLEDFVSCNYMYYSNTYNGKTKRYYCFITQKEQISNNAVKLSIALDVFQTWQFDMLLHACFIERMHVASDEIGEHTVPEPLELGDYVAYGRQEIDILKDNEICYLLAIADSDCGTKIGKMYSGYNFYIYKSTDVDKMSKKINEMAKSGKSDEIGYIAMYPQQVAVNMFGNFASGTQIKNLSNENSYFTQDVVFKVGTYFGLGYFYEYAPKNNKLFTYPYTFLTVTTNDSSNVVLKFELFDELNKMNRVTFKLSGTFGQNPTFELTPYMYKNLELSLDDSATLQGFGLCSWINDNFSNWYAQNQNKIHAQSANAIASYNANNAIAQNNYQMSNVSNIANTATNAVNNIASLLTGNIVSGLTGGLNTAVNYAVNAQKNKTDLANSKIGNDVSYQNAVRSQLASVRDAKVQPNTCKGDTSTCGLDIARGTNNFFITRMGIKKEFARIIDGYFQMYGYQVNLPCTYPRTNTRVNWNYIKTLDCNVTGNVPVEDRLEIQKLYNSGFTVWHDCEKMYNWDSENPIRK